MFTMANLKTVKRSFHIVIGITIGFILAIKLQLDYKTIHNGALQRFCCTEYPIKHDASFQQSLKTIRNLLQREDSRQDENKRKLLLIGIMTAKKFLNSRSLAILNTWAKDLDGDIIFFSSSDSKSNERIPLVSLPGVDDSYPPQKKSFLMFKFLNDYFGNQYKFFMRADDDLFVNVERLKKFLVNLNDSEPLFLGQTGVGNQDEFGQLNLDLHENFCMGGPGMIMSRITLQILGENVESCLKNLHSTHEDVEIGRCVHRFAKTSCTWSYDMQRLFFHNSSIQNSILEGIFPANKLYKAITVHPIKHPDAMNALYKYYKRQKIQNLNRIISDSYRKIFDSKIDQFSNEELMKLLQLKRTQQVKEFRDNVNQHDRLRWSTDLDNNWMFFSQKVFSERTINPKRNIDRDLLEAFQNNLPIIMDEFNRKSMKMSRILDVHSLYYGYTKHDPFIGAQYMLDISMIYRKYQGKKMTIPIRRHTYAVQSLAAPHIRLIPIVKDRQKIVNIIVPLYGRRNILNRFINNLKAISKFDSRLTLTLVNFVKDNETFVNNFNLDNIPVNIINLKGQFSRGLALQKSLQTFQDDDLLCFLDVDMTFTAQVFETIRRNTILGLQVYFPIVFSQYSTGNWSNLEIIDNRSGYWRQFGYGIASLYKCDLLSVGGYDENIAGWGLEDVALFDRLLQNKNLTIFRSVESELVHVYHTIHCDPELSPKQYEMCLGTLLSSTQSSESLMNYVIKNDIFY